VRRIASERRREMGRGIMSVIVTVIVGKGSEVVAVKGIEEDETGNAIMSVIVRERGKEIMVTGLIHGIGNERGK
jgi:hypothetical protein